MTTNELITLLESNPNCNFLACCGSVLQVNGVNAAIMYLKSTGVELNGFVIVEGTNSFKKEDYKKKYFQQESGIRYIDGELLFGDLKWWQRFAYIGKKKELIKNTNRERIIYIVSDSFRFYWIRIINEVFFDKRIVYVEIDDGASSYKSKPSDALFVRLGKSRKYMYPYVLSSYFLKRIFNTDYVSILKKTKNYIDCKALREENGEIMLNRHMISFFDNSFKSNISEADYEEIKCFEGSIIILGFHLDKDSFDKFIEFINEVKIIANGFGISLVVKPHPRDNVIFYKEKRIDIFDHCNVAVEEIIVSLKKKPVLIIGCGGSALINAKILYDVPTMSCSSLIKPKTWYSKYINNAFRDRFGGIVECPKSVNDAMESISKILNNT